MRFQRNAKIFRGRLDAAPLAGVFFLLVIFMLLASLVYTPGIPIQLSANGAKAMDATKAISISKDGNLVFNQHTYTTNSLEQLRNDLKSLPANTTLVIAADANAPRELVERLSSMARQLELDLATPGAGIDLPTSHNLVGTTNPTVVVAINLSGHYFFENQIIGEAQLKENLAAAAKRVRSPLTLIVLADKGVEYESVIRLTQIAQDAGIRQALLQQRPEPKLSR